MSDKIRGYRVSIPDGAESIYCSTFGAVCEAIEVTGLFDDNDDPVTITVTYDTKEEIEAMGDFNGF